VSTLSHGRGLNCAASAAASSASDAAIANASSSSACPRSRAEADNGMSHGMPEPVRHCGIHIMAPAHHPSGPQGTVPTSTSLLHAWHSLKNMSARALMPRMRGMRQRPSATGLNPRAVLTVVRPTAASPAALRPAQSPLALAGRARRVAVAKRAVRVSAAATTPSSTPWERLQGAQVLRGTDGQPVLLTAQWCVHVAWRVGVDPPSCEHGCMRIDAELSCGGGEVGPGVVRLSSRGADEKAVVVWLRSFG
jgi:hypothetical protein